jgi:GH24 family phage-related lysozyme (muramidase)
MAANFELRIKNVQTRLGVDSTGMVDDETAKALAMKQGLSASGSTLVVLKRVQKAMGLTDDGVIGPLTLTRIEALLTEQIPPIPAGASLCVSLKSIDLLVNFEVSSKETYTKNYQKAIWPGGQSGVTIGIGYDLGYATAAQITKAWKDELTADELNQYLAVAGKTGPKCQDLLPGLKLIKVPYEKAYRVFYKNTLPEFAGTTKKTYPGTEKLPPDAQGALLSLIYNRGGSLKQSDPRRQEMIAIKPLVAAGDLAGIAAQIRSMKRLWNKAEMPGLHARREQEAKLVEQATMSFLPETVVMV